MNTSFNLTLDMAAVLLLVVEMTYVRIQYAHDKYRNRLFIMLLHSTFLFALADIASSLMLTTYVLVVPSPIVRFTTGLYYFTDAFCILVFYRYIVVYLGGVKNKTVAYMVRTYFPFVFIVECLIANQFANILFSGGKYGHFSYGAMFIVIYLYPIYYFLLTIITLFRNRKVASLKQHISVISFVVIVFTSMVVQVILQDVMTIPFGFAIALLIIILNMETPDYRELLKTTELLETVRTEQDRQERFNRIFIEQMAYEVCGPVGKLLAKNEEDFPELHEYVEGYGKQIRANINNVMEFVMMEEPRDEEPPREYSVRRMVEDACNIMMPAVKDNSDTLDVEISTDIPDVLLGDEKNIKQVLLNLLGDAVQYTRGGHISLTVSARRLGNDSVNLVLAVEDSGRGMKRDMIKSLLQFNTKSRDWKKGLFEGGNFRVKITKQIIESMNGKLHIDSAIGKGSVFTAIIPQGTVGSN